MLQSECRTGRQPADATARAPADGTDDRVRRTRRRMEARRLPQARNQARSVAIVAA